MKKVKIENNYQEKVHFVKEKGQLKGQINTDNQKKMKNPVKNIIFQTVKNQASLSIGIVIAVIGAILMALLPPLVLAKIVDSITAGHSVSIAFIVLYFVLLAATGLMESAREALLTVFGQKITHALRSSLMEKFRNLTTDNINKQEPGMLVSRFIGDVDTVENLFTSGIISMFADACKIISILVVIWFQNPGLTVLLTLLLPFLFWFTRYVQKNMLAAQIHNRKAVGRASGHVPETLHNIRTIHCLGKEKYMEERYDEYINDSYQAMEKTNFYDAIYSPVILILNAIVVAVVMLLSASGNARVLTFFGMSAGTAVAVINYISQIFTPVESLGMEIQTIQSALAGIHRINEFYELEERSQKNRISDKVQSDLQCNEKSDKVQRHLQCAESSEKNTGFYSDTKDVSKEKCEQYTQKKCEKQEDTLVELRDVTFGYDEHAVLEHTSFQVKEGEQATISGRTGAGKSTIFKLLLGLYAPQSGEVLIARQPAVSLSEKEKRKWFGYVEQSFHMVPGTVREQITLYDDSITEEQVKSVAELTGLDSVIKSFESGYDTICTPELFSQGQWQLLSIARAAVAEPKILLLDEITANLDAETERHVLQALKRVSEKRTVISISHRTSAEMGRLISI